MPWFFQGRGYTGLVFRGSGVGVWGLRWELYGIVIQGFRVWGSIKRYIAVLQGCIGVLNCSLQGA